MSSTKTTTKLTTLNLTGAVEINHLDFDGQGAEMGFFFIFSLISVFFLLNQLGGRIFRMKIFLMNRDFNLVRNETVIKIFT
jgi:hypothetical protein